MTNVGFALLFPTPKLPARSLWEAGAGEDSAPFATGMGANEQTVWAWKDGQDHGIAVRQFLDTMLATTPADLARAFRWAVADARGRLDELSSRGQATSVGGRYKRPDGHGLTV